MTETIKLTQYSHGAGCGCKISPSILDKILKSNEAAPMPDERLLVGNHSRDDAAVYDLLNGTALISTTDFFMPIVDDPYEFGRIASANAISDVYAMGGNPVLAIAILGWPIDKLPPEVAQRVIEGSRSICREAGIMLAGGHSIDSPEPIFGLAVNGLVNIENLKQNNTAEAGNILFLTKPLGIGILTTAEKKGILREEDKGLAAQWMMKLNTIGAKLGALKGVRAMTDVTGFGLLGHLSEMCEGSGVSAEITFKNVSKFDNLGYYLEKKSTPGGTTRNFDSYGHKIAELTPEQKSVLCDPQTSGGLLVAVAPESVAEIEELFKKEGLGDFLQPIGFLKEQGGNLVEVR
ncbi:MAG: selenide, water dikinase SelD [Bacteroidota bacterium]